MTCSRKSLLRCATVFLVFCGSVVLCADAQTAAQPSGDGSWAASSQTTTNGANPSRTTESHTKSGNRTFNKKIVEVPGIDGEYQPYSDIETESVQESPTATRSIVRTYNPGANGQKQLAQVTEENTQTLGDGKID